MNKQARIEEISRVVARDQPYTTTEILWKNDQLQKMPVYLIPLKCLVYNKYNGRILSRTKSLETQDQTINAETEQGSAIIERLLWETNEGRNKQTLASIKKTGQEKIGIITKDGIIIDGNRRAMLLKKAGKDHFKAVVLDVTLEDDPLEIERLETIYQMGEDEKLGYNAVEKYLKAKGLLQQKVEIEKIASWMGETPETVKQYIAVMKTMDEYLQFHGYHGIYTQLDEREDHFINLTKWLTNFYGEKSAKAFEGYRDSDVDDLQAVAFDYIRALFEGKEFRLLAQGLRENHLFGNKPIWQSFSKVHFEKVKPVKDSEPKIDTGSENLKATLDERDRRFSEAVNDKDGRFLRRNLREHEQKLRFKSAAARPLELAGDAIDALSAIDRGHDSSRSKQVVDKVRELRRKTAEYLVDKSATGALVEVIEMLKAIRIKPGIPDKESLLGHIKEIEKLAYSLEKAIKEA